MSHLIKSPKFTLIFFLHCIFDLTVTVSCLCLMLPTTCLLDPVPHALLQHVLSSLYSHLCCTYNIHICSSKGKKRENAENLLYCHSCVLCLIFHKNMKNQSHCTFCNYFRQFIYCDLKTFCIAWLWPRYIKLFGAIWMWEII